MRRLLAVAGMLSLALALTGCGKKEKGPPPGIDAKPPELKFEAVDPVDDKGAKAPPAGDPGSAK